SDIGQSIQAMGQNSLQAKQEELLDAQISQVKTDTELARQEVIAGQTARSVNKNPQTEMKIGGAEVNKNKDWSDAQIIEDRYGDVVSWAYGLGVVGADLYQAIKDKTKAPDSDINKIINEIKQYKLNLKFKNNSIGNSGKGKFYR
ncbi:hypothetical protein, partial [Sulfurovum sp.]|uniref:hypothetical protein n=1 Tax=Sulfurovum sp. TaxID=1969726 RepID=UPI003561DCCF